MERLERNAWIGVLNWLSLSILVLLGLCANNQMLHTQWYWFFIFPFYMTKMLQCMDSQKIKKIKCCNIIICVYFNLAKKCVYIYILLLFSLFLSSLHIFMQINTCNGWYCDQFTPNSPNSPKIWTENWTGWYIFLLFSLIYNIYIYIYWIFNYIAFENLGTRVRAQKIHIELPKILVSLLQGFSSIVAPLWTITWYA